LGDVAGLVDGWAWTGCYTDATCDRIILGDEGSRHTVMVVGMQSKISYSQAEREDDSTKEAARDEKEDAGELKGTWSSWSSASLT
jgi:hypothetical protein